jgi:hypothetical protein
MRRRTIIRPAVTALLLALALAGPAAAQQAPELGAPSSEETATQAPATTTGQSEGGLATWQEALIFAAGLILLGGIAFAIVADARQRAGGDDGRGPLAETAGGGGHRHKQQSKQRSRAKAKAARAQRRRNR